MVLFISPQLYVPNPGVHYTTLLAIGRWPFLLPISILQVDAINQLFRDHRDNPPISKNQPPVAGAITWSRALFKRIKHTVVRLRTMKELINTAKGKQVRS